MSVAQVTGTADPFAQAKQYLARVLPWPDRGEAYVNICNTFQGAAHDKPAWGGRAVTSFDQAINYIQWSVQHQDTRDIYVCMSTQREPGHAKVDRLGRTYYRANRNQPNAVALKALFLDIDTKITKQDGKGYSSPQDAIAALADFIKATGLPRPNVVVSSGGGYHVYWVLSRALTVEEWKPLAYALAEATKQHGLKCDTQCTIDSARVLRIPGTANCKVDPPPPVKLASMIDNDYSVERLEQVLAPYKAAVSAAQPTTSFLLDPSLWTPRAPVEDDLGKGIETERPPIKLDDVAAECAFISDALTSGGKDYSQPLWNLTTLISTFTEGGCADAHRMGNKHPGYSQQSTDDFYNRKEREKNEKGLGWPSCKTISGSGCTACQTCPHFAKGKSPLHLAGRRYSRR
jgi:hypothetical protein